MQLKALRHFLGILQLSDACLLSWEVFLLEFHSPKFGSIVLATGFKPVLRWGDLAPFTTLTTTDT